MSKTYSAYAPDQQFLLQVALQVSLPEGLGEQGQDVEFHGHDAGTVTCSRNSLLRNRPFVVSPVVFGKDTTAVSVAANEYTRIANCPNNFVDSVADVARKTQSGRAHSSGGSDQI